MNAVASFTNGTVSFHQCDLHPDTLIEFNFKGFEPNSNHAIHVLTYGCSNPINVSHYNPHNECHGSFALNGNHRHAGDLINNLLFDSNGCVCLQYKDPLIDVKEILGRSIAIYKGVDDLISENAGDIIERVNISLW